MGTKGLQFLLWRLNPRGAETGCRPEWRGFGWEEQSVGRERKGSLRRQERERWPGDSVGFVQDTSPHPGRTDSMEVEGGTL